MQRMFLFQIDSKHGDCTSGIQCGREGPQGGKVTGYPVDHCHELGWSQEGGEEYRDADVSSANPLARQKEGPQQEVHLEQVKRKEGGEKKRGKEM